MNDNLGQMRSAVVRIRRFEGVPLIGVMGVCLLILLLSSCSEEKKDPVVPDTDSTPPAAIVDLAIGTVRATDVGLTWTAPGDDGGEGTATSYDLRYSTASIDSSSWDQATRAADPPSPGDPGSTESVTIGGLQPGTTYYFRLKAADEVPNWSALSNIGQTTTESPYAIWSDEFAAPPEGAGTDGPIQAFLEFNGELVVGGHFDQAGAVSGVSNIARWDGASWHAMGTGASGFVWAEIDALIEYDGDLIAAGGFSEIGGVPANNIARWDGANWSPLGQGTNDAVMCLEVFEGDLIVGGWFHRAGGVNADLVARWDGEEWSAMGVGLDHPDTNIPVWDLLVYNDQLYAGGGFVRSGGSTVQQVARWDGGTWKGVGSGFAETGQGAPSVRALAVFRGQLYAAGGFTAADGASARGIARWDGSGWKAVGTGVAGDFPSGISLVVFRDDLVLGGNFTSVSGYSANNIARWDGATWRALDSGITASAYSAVNVQAVWKGDLIVGGTFEQAGGIESRNIARLIPLTSGR